MQPEAYAVAWAAAKEKVSPRDQGYATAGLLRSGRTRARDRSDEEETGEDTEELDSAALEICSGGDNADDDKWKDAESDDDDDDDDDYSGGGGGRCEEDSLGQEAAVKR